jgi:hypothetical protein
VVYGKGQLLAGLWKSAAGLSLSWDVQTFARVCETLVVSEVVGYCRGSRCMAVGSLVGETAVAAFPAYIASEDTWRMGELACQSYDRRIEVGNLHSSVDLLVFQSFHFQARDLSLESL